MYKDQLYNRVIIEISGQDKHSLLNSIVSKNILKLSESKGVYALHLTPQGKFLFDMFIIQKDEVLWIDILKDMAEKFLQRLRLYKLRAQVEWRILSEIKIYALYDIANFASLQLEEQEGSSRWQDGELRMVDPRIKEMGIRYYTTGSSLEEYTLGNYEKWRIGQGVCEGGSDLIYEKSFPMQFGLDKLNAIDFDKGCYVGQEVTARSKYRGNIKKTIYCVVGKQNLTSHTNIYKEDKIVGQLLSCFENLGIALIDNEIDAVNEKLKIENTELTCRMPAWFKR